MNRIQFMAGVRANLTLLLRARLIHLFVFLLGMFLIIAALSVNGKWVNPIALVETSGFLCLFMVFAAVAQIFSETNANRSLKVVLTRPVPMGMFFASVVASALVPGLAVLALTVILMFKSLSSHGELLSVAANYLLYFTSISLLVASYMAFWSALSKTIWEAVGLFIFVQSYVASGFEMLLDLLIRKAGVLTAPLTALNHYFFETLRLVLPSMFPFWQEMQGGSLRVAGATFLYCAFYCAVLYLIATRLMLRRNHV